jgi:hypothetical protein
LKSAAAHADASTHNAHSTHTTLLVAVAAGRVHRAAPSRNRMTRNDIVKISRI